LARGAVVTIFSCCSGILEIRVFGLGRPIVSVVRLGGVIGQVGPLRRGLTMQGLAGTLDRAFSGRKLRAVALQINSPGGSPVQSALIHRRIRQLADKADIPVLVFVEDVAASGGYWLACAGDEIFADSNSIVGSIGVISAGFGFTDAISRLGIERRVHSAGERKVMLDPFLPEKEEDVDRIKAIQADIHDSFKDLVRARRGRRLKGGDDDLFTGDVWTGRRAVEMGLIDGLGDLRSVVRDRFGEKVKFRVIGQERGWLRRKLGLRGGDRGSLPDLGGSFASGLLAAMEERAWWSRLGL
jgi:signal peptide peptidase SppA